MIRQCAERTRGPEVRRFKRVFQCSKGRSGCNIYHALCPGSPWKVTLGLENFFKPAGAIGINQGPQYRVLTNQVLTIVLHLPPCASYRAVEQQWIGLPRELHHRFELAHHLVGSENWSEILSTDPRLLHFVLETLSLLEPQPHGHHKRAI